MYSPTHSAPRTKTFGSMAPKSQAKPRWDASLPIFSFRDFANKAIEFRFVGAPFCHKLHTIYLELDHARELKRWRNRERNDKSPANIPQSAKAFDVVCPDFDYIDEKSYPGPNGYHTCDCCSTYGDYVKERLQYFAWCFYKDPNTKQWVPELKVLRFPKTVAEGINEAIGLMEDPNGNQIEDIADWDLGGTVIISYNPGAAPAQQYRVNRGNLMVVDGQMRAFAEANMRPFEEVYRLGMQDPADITRSLAHWKYPSLMSEAVPGATQGFGNPSAAGFGGSFGAPATQAMPGMPSATFDAPPSFNKAQAAPAPTVPTFGGEDTIPSFGGGAAATIPTFGADDSVPTFGAPAAVPSFGGAGVPSFGGTPTPKFMEDTGFGAPLPPAGRGPASGGF